MADGTVRGGFELSAEQPIRSLTAIRDRGREADQALERLGRRMDTLATNTTATWGQMSRTVDTHADRIEGRLSRLEVKLRDLGRVNATPTVELGGFARVNAQLSELEARLDRLSRQRATPSVGLGGGFAGAGGGGGGAAGGDGGGRAFSTLGGLGGRFPWWAALIPGAPALVGGATSLVGSAGSAALGGATVGLGGLGPLLAGGGLSAIAIKTSLTGLQQITQAQQRYNLVVQEYGRASSQAATAQLRLNAAMAMNPAAVGAARQIQQFRSQAGAAFAPARAQVYRGISGVTYNATRALPAVGADATLATSATSSAAVSFSRFLTDPQQLTTLRQLTVAFAQDLPIAERVLEHMATTFGHLAVAATPFFREGLLWVDHWSAGIARSTGDTARVQGKMQGYVDSAKDWARLTGAAYRTIRDIFSAGTPAGDSMVVELTHTLDRWDQWIQRNPEKLRAFFAQAKRDVSSIANTLVGAIRDVWQVLQQISPIVGRLFDALGFITGIGPGGIGLGGAALYGAYGGIRGATGNRLPSGGALAGSFIMGGAGRGLMRGGGGAVVGGGAYSSTLARSQPSYLMPPSGRFSPTLGNPIPAGALGSELPLLAAIAGTGYAGTMLAGGAASPLNFGQRVAQLRAQSGLPLAEARYGGPMSIAGELPFAARTGAISRVAGLGGAALSGIAKFALPVLAITSALQGAQAPGGFGHKLETGLNTALHLGTFGILPSNSIQRLLGSGNAGASFDKNVVAAVQGFSTQAGAVRTPQQLQALQRDMRATAHLRLEMSPQDAAKLQSALAKILDTATTNAGVAAANSWQDAFTRALDRGVKPRKAVDTMLSGMVRQLHDMGPKGSKAFASSTAAWVSQLEADNPKLRRPLERLMNGIVSDLNDMQRKTEGAAKATRDQVFFYNGQILTGSTTAWRAISKSMIDPALVAQEKLLGIFGAIQAEAVNALTQMGFSRADARTIVTQTAKGGKTAAATAGVVSTQQSLGPGVQLTSRHPKARGGQIGGQGLMDTVRLPDGSVAAPGEAWIANRHTMMDLSSATLEKYGKTAWEMIRDEHRQHSAPRSLGGLLGGAVSTAGSAIGAATARGNSGWVHRQHPELHAGIAAAVEQVLNRFPLSITSTTRGGHASGSYHYLGEAADIAGAGGLMNRAAGWIASSGLFRSLTEGIHNPNLSVKGGQNVPSSYWGASTWAEHVNHIHMAVAGALGAFAGGGGGAQGMMASALNLRAPRSGLAGVPGALADQGSRIYARGLSQQINKRTGASGISAAGFTGGGSSGANQALGRRMMLAAGWPASEWPALQALWSQESGWSAAAVNPSSGAYGIPQSLGHGHPYNLGDAPAQIAWGLNYIRGRYGSPSAAEAHERSAGWYQRGGRWDGWHRLGGSFTTRGPTLFGAGEGGRRERVTISPAHTPTGSGARIQVIMQNVHLGSGSTQDLERVAEEVAGKILDALEGAGPGGSDADLIGAGS